MPIGIDSDVVSAGIDPEEIARWLQPSEENE
jgi:hypothetical protein